MNAKGFVGARAFALALALLCLAFALCSCNAAGAQPPAISQASPVEVARDNAAVPSDGSVASEAAKPTGDHVASSKYAYDDAQVDIDLTQMSGTAVYSAVYQMMVDPAAHQDQVVKMQGVFYSQYDDATKRRYYFVVVKDATACCSQGIEFVWDDGEHVYPDDYPAEGAEAVVCGRFGTYTERNAQFARLNQASLQLAG